MDKRSHTGNKASPLREENLCAYCLFFEPRPGAVRTLKGNCVYHKEWIENASRTTCGDMSKQPLEQKGIYCLVANDETGWLYVRRAGKIRTRLFLVK